VSGVFLWGEKKGDVQQKKRTEKIKKKALFFDFFSSKISGLSNV